jgi:glycosyltransferase involved in cell wall biosynthesis
VRGQEFVLMCDDFELRKKMGVETVNDRKLPILAVVVPSYNEEDSLPHAEDKLLEVLDGLVLCGKISSDSFIYFIDDGSVDRSWKLLSEMNLRDGRIKALKLSRNFGHQNALFAGLVSIKDKCDAVISIDADLQQDPNVISDFVDAYINGSDIVYGVRNDRSSDGVSKKVTAIAFYRLMSWMGVTTIKNHADYRLLSRRALAALTEHSEPNLFLRAICTQLGFKSDTVYFDVKAREIGVSKYTLRKMINLALSGIVSFSVSPLRMIAVIGVAIFGVTTLMSAYIFLRTLLIGDTAPGWASTALPIYFLGGIQIMCMGVIGEYLAEVLMTVKRRPRYISEDELL